MSTQPTEDKITGAGGLNIVVRSWQPEQAARAVVAIVPGFNSHGGYYTWVAQQFIAAGLLKHYEGYFHDLLNDTGKEQVMAQIQAWIDARIPAVKTQSAVALLGE